MKLPASRRDFLLASGGQLLFLPAAAATLGELSHSLAAETAGSDAYWQKIREQFPFGEDKVPMNAANLCPSPRSVTERLVELTRDIDHDCSFNNRAKFAELVEASRSKVAQALAVSADEIALVRNTSEANNVINNGIDLRPGDEVLLWDQNHPTNNVAWDVRAARFGLSVKRLALKLEVVDQTGIIDTFAAALTDRTRVLALTHVSNVSGIRLPVSELCELAHRRGIHVHVDGAQTWGAFNVHLPSLGCDSYSASAHKWFVGPREVGLLYVKQQRLANVWPSVVAPGWGSDVEPDVRGARKFESLGQRDDAALAAVGDTADFHAAIGVERIERRIVELANHLKEGIRGAGLELVTPLEPELSGGVCIVRAPPDRGGAIAERLYTEYGIAGAATGGIRLCPHIYNTREHIDRAVRAIRSLLA